MLLKKHFLDEWFYTEPLTSKEHFLFNKILKKSLKSKKDMFIFWELL